MSKHEIRFLFGGCPKDTKTSPRRFWRRLVQVDGFGYCQCVVMLWQDMSCGPNQPTNQPTNQPIFLSARMVWRMMMDAKLWGARNIKRNDSASIHLLHHFWIIEWRLKMDGSDRTSRTWTCQFLPAARTPCFFMMRSLQWSPCRVVFGPSPRLPSPSPSRPRWRKVWGRIYGCKEGFRRWPYGVMISHDTGSIYSPFQVGAAWYGVYVDVILACQAFELP